MRQCRGKAKGSRWVESGKWVVGWYLFSDGKHYIVDCCGVTSTAMALNNSIGELPGYNEVIPESVGQDTGRTGKNDIPIFGSLEGTKGGDKTNHGVVEWCSEALTFLIDGMTFDVYDTETWPLEVIGKLFDSLDLLEK